MNVKITVAILVMVASSGNPGLAQQPAQQQSTQQTFASAAEASQSLFQAVQRKSGQDIAKMLGGSTELTSSSGEALNGQDGQDELDRQLFIRKYQEMHRLARQADGSVTLYVGAENWPFPVPLVKKNGVWFFDAEAGLQEVLFRRIGENELTAIEVCHELVAAKKQARTQPDAAEPILIHGYYFHPLATGFIAYPAEYRSSGVMTFVVSANDVVYEKDLGANTSTLAAGMRAFHKDTTWRTAHE
jgi:hypothetical protein